MLQASVHAVSGVFHAEHRRSPVDCAKPSKKIFVSVPQREFTVEAAGGANMAHAASLLILKADA
jgi:hypothetical protein